MTATDLRTHANRLRALAARGVTQLTHNGKTVRYPSPKDMLDAADRLENRADQLSSLNRSAMRPSNLVYSRR